MPQPSTATRGRLRTLATSVISAAPTSTDRPHFTLSPRGPGGEPCVGFGFCMIAAAAGPATFPADVATVIPWIWMATLRVWAPFSASPGYILGQYYVCFDVTGGTKLYYQVTGASVDGNVTISLDSLP